MHVSKKVAATMGAGTIAVAVSGVAFAYWTTSANGTGSTSTEAGVVDSLSFTTTTITSMYPGDVAQPLVVKVTNTDTHQKVYVNTVKAYVTTDKTGCTGGDFLIGSNPAPSTAATAVALGWTAQELSAGGFASTSGDTIHFNNKTSPQDACKSATVTINYVAS